MPLRTKYIWGAIIDAEGVAEEAIVEIGRMDGGGAKVEEVGALEVGRKRGG